MREPQSSITIRPALEKEADTIVKFINHVYAEVDKSKPVMSYRKPGPIGNRTNKEEIYEKIKNPSVYFCVAVDSSRPPEDQIVGTLCLNINKKTTPQLKGEFTLQGEITLFAIHEERRSTGLGTLMENHVEGKAKSRGVSELLAETEARQGNLMEYYKKQGFFLAGTLGKLKSERFKENYEGENEITLIQMVKSLK